MLGVTAYHPSTTGSSTLHQKKRKTASESEAKKGGAESTGCDWGGFWRRSEWNWEREEQGNWKEKDIQKTKKDR